jgi:hypothetical protein
VSAVVLGAGKTAPLARSSVTLIVSSSATPPTNQRMQPERV